MQQSVKSPVRFTGLGLHSGKAVTMVVRPAPANHGLWFRRVDVAVDGTGRNADVPAIWSAVSPTRLCTLVENGDGVSVSTIEHLMAAFAGCSIQNALIEIDAPEVPILDGSAAPFVRAFLQAGLERQDGNLRMIRVLRPVSVQEGLARASLAPAEMLEMDFSIDFADEAIGKQDYALNLSNGAFVRELSDSRTFCRFADIEMMRERGLALGGTLENAVVFDGPRVVSPGGLRHADEPVRHKMLDAVGDLYIAGGPILGRYTGVRAGHALTNQLLRALFADPQNYRIEECGGHIGQKLPGVGVNFADLPMGQRVAA